MWTDAASGGLITFLVDKGFVALWGGLFDVRIKCNIKIAIVIFNQNSP